MTCTCGPNEACSECPSPSNPSPSIDGFRKEVCKDPHHCAQTGCCIDRDRCFGVMQVVPNASPTSGQQIASLQRALFDAIHQKEELRAGFRNLMAAVSDASRHLTPGMKAGTAEAKGKLDVAWERAARDVAR